MKAITQIAITISITTALGYSFIYAISSEMLFNQKCINRSTATETYTPSWFNGRQVCNKVK